MSHKDDVKEEPINSEDMYQIRLFGELHQYGYCGMHLIVIQYMCEYIRGDIPMKSHITAVIVTKALYTIFCENTLYWKIWKMCK